MHTDVYSACIYIYIYIYIHTYYKYLPHLTFRRPQDAVKDIFVTICHYYAIIIVIVIIIINAIIDTHIMHCYT